MTSPVKIHITNTVIEAKKDAVIRILKDYGVKRAAIFGSIARGDFTGKSDIDLLVEFEGRKSLLDLSGLKLALEDLFGRKVDVLTYNSLHPLIKENILKEQEIIL
ncbi:MAG: nucleotidyltransferase family protein [Nitrospiraceae bacterium]|nr:nucleotidyltransferase family protein [Nitrospiraceae bacterium]